MNRHPQNPMAGKKHTPEAIEKIRLSKLGKKRGKQTEKWRRKRSEVQQREKGHNWQGGRTSEIQLVRVSIDYRLWREAVLARDNFTCQKCGKKNGNLEAHHIKSFNDYPELRFAIDNGKTLCEDCHRLTF